MSGHTLILIRHAKAEAAAPTDHARRLSERGHADAGEAGEWLRHQDIEPDAALVSDAARTSETWEDIATAADWDFDAAEYSGELYAAGPHRMLEVVQETDEDVRTLVVVGHNPTISALAEFLDDGKQDEAASADVAAGFPTSGLAILEFEGKWEELDEAGASVVAFHVGRG
ncbi:MAG TPA: histidine phosphatase family protein [Nocardioides sp.]|nr:histidine phosphatase family protein [Nocardioides sp.]